VDTAKQKEMMQSIMACIGGTEAKEMKEMCAGMLGKMAEGLDTKKMMTSKMSGGTKSEAPDQPAVEPADKGDAAAGMSCGCVDSRRTRAHCRPPSRA